MHLSQINPKPLLVASDEVGYGSHSGYSILSNYISECNTIFTPRNKSVTLQEKLLNKLLRNFSISNWYQMSSAQLEWLIWKKIQEVDFSLIHFLWGERDLGYADLFTDKNLLPLCSTFHACSDDLSNIISFSSRRRIRKLAAIIIVSESQREFFEQNGIEPHKIHFIHHGVDVEFFKPNPTEKLYHPFTLLSVGSYRRNFTYLREVFNQLKTYKNIHIKVISSTNNFHYFSDLENVEFISNISDADLLKTYQSASCQIISVENATANNALLEGLACGLPVIAEKIGGIPEYVNNSCSVLTDYGDIKSTVGAIIELSQSSSEYSSMTKAARERALELSWFNTAQKIENLYSSLSNRFKVDGLKNF